MNNRISHEIKKLTSQVNGSFFLYDKWTIDNKINELTSNLNKFEFLYSIKSNPFDPLVKHILNNGLGADAASSAEVNKAIELGAKTENIFYSSPGKTKKDIEETIDKCTIIADSYSELNLLNNIASKQKKTIRVGIRINPDFSMFEDEGFSSKFGIDEETLCENIDLLRSFSSISISGVHVHLHSQILDINILASYYKKIFESVLRLKILFGFNIEFINFGGGLGIPYSTLHHRAINIKQLNDLCKDILRKYEYLGHIRLIIETGRFIVCESGWYVTPIVDCKVSRGKKYLIVQNGLNGFMRPVFASLLNKVSIAKVDKFNLEPLFTCIDAFDFEILGKKSRPYEHVSIVGSLCTSTDILVENVALPSASIGDYVVVSKAGSYGFSLSPLLFSSHTIPQQFFIDSKYEH